MAERIANKFVTKSIFEMDNNELHAQRHSAKLWASLCVDEIIKALKTTTGHLTLKRLDEHEVEKDFDFWKDVKKEIEKL